MNWLDVVIDVLLTAAVVYQHWVIRQMAKANKVLFDSATEALQRELNAHLRCLQVGQRLAQTQQELADLRSEQDRDGEQWKQA